MEEIIYAGDNLEEWPHRGQWGNTEISNSRKQQPSLAERTLC